jgi:putative endonuclease
MKQYWVYMMTNTINRTLYIGVTSNLLRRVGEHRLKQVKGFTSRYNLGKLVYYDVFSQVDAAIAR